MASQDDSAPLESRPAPPDDLLLLCQLSNTHETRYVVVGGMAMIQHGLMRLTSDIDMLVDSSDENMGRIRSAMRNLPDAAINEVQPDDVRRYGVVRGADEFVTGLMHSALDRNFLRALMEEKGESVPTS